MIHFVIPLYNKNAGLIDSLKQIESFIKTNFSEQYEIILCNDGSTDNTLSLAKRFAEANSHIRVLGYEKNRGRGFAIKFAGAICRGEYIIYFDLDLPKTTNLHRLIEMAGYLQENDIVAGSRFLKNSKTKRLPLRGFVSRVYRWIVSLVLPELKIKDIDVGFKGFRTACFNEINRYSKMNGWAWDLEFLAIARAMGTKIKEFPIDWNEQHDNYNSTIHIFRDSIEELTGIINIRLRSLNKFKK